MRHSVKKMQSCSQRGNSSSVTRSSCVVRTSGYSRNWKMWTRKFQYNYTGYNRRNGPNFGRVFLMLNYNEKTQKTYIQSWTVWEIMAIENCEHPLSPRTIAWSPVRGSNVLLKLAWNAYPGISVCMFLICRNLRKFAIRTVYVDQTCRSLKMARIYDLNLSVINKKLCATSS